MALTRNLYRQDEVVAALRHSVVAGNVADALFWVQEGIESDMDVRIFQTLLSVWLHCVGVQNIPWLGCLIEALRSDLEEETIISLVVELVRSPKDSSVFALQVLGLEQTPETPDHVGAFTLPPALQGLSAVETAFAKAVLQGKVEFAWALAVPLWTDERAYSVLWEIQPIAVFNCIDKPLEPIWSDEFVWSFRALAILMAASKRDFQAVSLPPPPVEHVDAWNARKSMRMRARRQLSIPPECLYWFTKRGQMLKTETTETEMIGNIRPILFQSPFWEDKIEPEIIDEYMTSDIPDEWSSAARRVSHGNGVLSDSSAESGLLFENMLKQMFCSESSKLIWKGGERATKILIERWGCIQRGPSFDENIHAEYKNLKIFVEKWDLTPRRVVVSS
jgi:hypothetical protein